MTFIRLSLLSASLLLIHTAAFANNITALAPIFAPLQMKEGNHAGGYAVNIVRTALTRLLKEGDISNFNIDLMPWNRAMAISQSQPDTLFFSISRTKEREDKYHWISEISPYEVYFFKLKGNPLSVQNLDEIKQKSIRVGVQKSSNAESLLFANGFKPNKNFVTYSHYKNGIPMLFHKRFQMLPLTIFVARTNTCKLGLDGDAIEPALRINDLSKPLWLVANKNMAPNLVEKLRTTMTDLKTEGYMERMQNRYLDQWKNQPCLPAKSHQPN